MTVCGVQAMADNIPLNPHFLKGTLKPPFRKWGQGVLFWGILKYGVTVVFFKGRPC